MKRNVINGGRMIKEKNVKPKKNYRSFTILFIIVLVSILFFSGFSMGKEITNTNLKGGIDVAKPILVLKGDEELNIKSISNTDEYSFYVRNYTDEGKINEIPMFYNIEIIKDTNSFISYKLLKNNEEIEIKDNKTKNMDLKTNENQEDIYKLKIICKNEGNSLDEILGKIKIKVHSEQKRL